MEIIILLIQFKPGIEHLRHRQLAVQLFQEILYPVRIDGTK